MTPGLLASLLTQPLAWTAPSGCPTPDELAAILATEPALASTTAPRLEAHISALGPHAWALSFAVAGQPATARTLIAERCEDLADVAVLWTTMALRGGPRPPEPAPAVIALRKPVVPPPDAVEATTSPRPPRSLRVQWSARAVAGVEVGALPHPTPNLALELGLAWLDGPLEAALGVKATLPSAASVDPARDLGAVFGVVAGTAALCWRAPTPGLSAGLCARAELGAEYAQGLGVARPRAATVPWFALGGGPELVLALPSPWRWVVHMEFMHPTRRPTFALGGVGAVHRASELVVALSCGLEVAF